MISALVLACGYLAWTMVSTISSLPSTPRSEPDTQGYDRFRLSGFQHTVYVGGRPVLKLEAREMSHRKRRFGPVTVNPIKELVLHGVTIHMVAGEERDQATAGAAAIHLAALMEQMLSEKGLGLVTRVLIEDLEFTLLEGEIQAFSLSATEAELALDQQAVQLRNGFQVITSRGDQLRAHRGRWRARDRVFTADGPYLLRTASGPAHGADGTFLLGPAGAILRQ